ncbi:toprim domain-containing protein [Brevibacillus borstelensis]|uniref:toprim domain-containing protein n=1 Tax=Brevibacillus borstelensis TaxID=45462 RepID=UPI0030BEE1CD
MDHERAIIVEGKTDRERLQKVLAETVLIVCTYGSYSAEKAAQLEEQLADEEEIYIFTDEDDSGKKLRAQLQEDFPHAVHLHTQTLYAQVAHTPLELLADILERAGFLVTPKNQESHRHRG